MTNEAKDGAALAAAESWLSGSPFAPELDSDASRGGEMDGSDSSTDSWNEGGLAMWLGGPRLSLVGMPLRLGLRVSEHGRERPLSALERFALAMVTLGACLHATAGARASWMPYRVDDHVADERIGEASFVEIGIALGVGTQRAKQIEQRALRKLGLRARCLEHHAHSGTDVGAIIRASLVELQRENARKSAHASHNKHNKHRRRAGHGTGSKVAGETKTRAA